MPPSVIRLQRPALLYLSLLMSVFAVAQYNPTRLFRNGEHVYVFQPSSQSSTQFQLGSIDLSNKIDAASSSYTTLCPTLPFLNDASPRAFTPVLDDAGNLTVYTGNCSQGTAGGEIWSFNPAAGNERSSWLRHDVSASNKKGGATTGANFLSSGVAFSSIVGGSTANTGAYFFGGMCPTPGDSSNDWQSAANYSNFMVTMSPSKTKNSVIAYELDLSSNRGPPIPEAGFTMTGLSPTYSNRSDGSQTQQQNFVLIGGHTSAAFINMSQIALFSLPEQGWTFISVQQQVTSHADQTASSMRTIDPRSGHTAVLSPDGQQVIVYGGWVGDTSSPAQPRLAILNIAEGYGGSGQWEWLVPNAVAGKGPPSDASLYGHGAVMLPGGVMMVTGGYTIAAAGSRRRATPTANSQAYFLNITSNTWIPEYTPVHTSSGSDSASTGPLSRSSQKAGLGVGIGVGLAAVCSLFAFYMWYTRRLKKQRDLREKQLQELSFAAHRYNIDDYSPEFDRGRGHADAIEYLAGHNGEYYFPASNQAGQGWKSAHGQDVERTGLLLEIPSPTRGLRRSLSGRPAYAMGAVRGPGQIHPIDELEEEDDETEHANDQSLLAERYERTDRRTQLTSSVLENAPQLDPFLDNRDGCAVKKIVPRSASSSPVLEDASEHEQLMAEWPGPSTFAVRRSNTVATGPISSDKAPSDERTNSNLSERSAQSNLSWTSSHGALDRTASLPVANVTTTTSASVAQASLFRSPNASPTHERPRSYSGNGRKTTADPRTESFSSVRSNSQLDRDTFTRSRSSFAHLQAEGEMLLGGRPEQTRPSTSSTSNGSSSHTIGDIEASHIHASAATPALTDVLDTPLPASRDERKSWLGSVRRVLRRSVSGTDRTRSLTNTISYHEPYTDNPGSPSQPPNTDGRQFCSSTQAPRRAASDATFWKSRRGKRDWEEEVEGDKWNRNSGDDWGAPEDIARAEKDRLRQEWRQRGNLLVDLAADEGLPAPRTPMTANGPDKLSVHQRPCTPADEGDWDVEAAIERRVVQVMFTVPKSKLRVVNADPDASSILSLPRENTKQSEDPVNGGKASSSSRVKDLAGKFEQISSAKGSSPCITPRASPVPSPSPSIKGVKVRDKLSSASPYRQAVDKI